MKRFIDQTGIQEYMSTLDLPQLGLNRGYSPCHIIESFWLGIWTGASRYIHCDWLRYDKTLHCIFGWDQMLSQSTYSRFFDKFSQARNTEISPKWQHWFMGQLGINNLTIDFDSTVITRYGEQQGSVKGYNPNKKGRNSHHPLMAFVSQTRMVANAWLRPRNTADSSSCKEFMEETFNQVLKDKHIGLVRADSGFYTQDLLEYLEAKQQNYIIATQMYPNVKNAIGGLDNWVSLTKGIDLNEMIFNHINGKPRRYIVVRKKIENRPKASGKLLFEDLPE